MAIKRWMFENQPNGTTVTVANSDDFGDPILSGVSRTGTAILQYSTDRAAFGTTSVKVSAGSGDTALMQGALAAASSIAPFQIFFNLTAFPTAEFALVQYRRAGGSSFETHIGTTGKVRLYNAADAGLGDTVAISLNTWYQLDLRGEKGTTTSNGKEYLELRQLGATEVLASVSNTATNAGTEDWAFISFGKTTTGGAITGMYVDAPAIGDNMGSVFIPAPSNTAPVADAGSDQTIAAGSNLVLSGSGSDADGTITGYAWTKVSGPAVTITTPTAATAGVTAIPAGHYTFRLTVTDDGGATGSDDVNVYVTTSTAVADAVISNAGWVTNTGSSADADLIAATADSSDATWIESPDNPSGIVTEQRVQPLAPGQVSVPYRVGADVASPARTVKVELMMGGTSIASKTETLTTSITAGSFLLTPTQLSALTGRNDLRLRFTAN